VLASGQRALARVSYLAHTRAKARLKTKTGQYLSGALALFAPELTPSRSDNRAKHQQNSGSTDLHLPCQELYKDPQCVTLGSGKQSS